MCNSTQAIQLSINSGKVVRTGRKTRNILSRRKGFCFPASPLAVPTTSALILPKITSIAPKLVYQKSVESTSKIALAFLDMGLAEDSDAVFAQTPVLFVDRIFKRWIAEKTATIKHFSPQFTITDDLDAFGEQSTNEDADMIVGISYSDGDATVCSLQAKIEALEKAAPGLGETAMSELYAWLCRTTLSISPDCVFSMVQQQYWQGGESEEDYLAEMRECGEDEENLEVAVTLADFESEFPRYTYSPSSRIARPELEQLTNHADPFVASVAAFLLTAPCQRTWSDKGQPEYLSDLNSDNQSVGYASIVHWNPDGSDITNRTCDDWINDIYQVGSSDLFAAYQFDQSLDGAKKLFASIEQYISALTWVDNAIGLLTTVEA